jgi:hypothetical protein
VVQAALKLDARTSSWANTLRFIQSCYAGRVRDYDFNEAMSSLARLSDEEQNALIAWVMLIEEKRQSERHSA